MEYGAIDLHKKESQVRIITDGGEVIDRRIRPRAIDSPPCSWGARVRAS